MPRNRRVPRGLRRSRSARGMRPPGCCVVGTAACAVVERRRDRAAGRHCSSHGVRRGASCSHMRRCWTVTRPACTAPTPAAAANRTRCWKRLNPHHFMYGHILTLWLACSARGDATRGSLERGALVDGDIAADFIAASGLPLALADCSTPRRSQCRLSADAQWFLREFNRRSADRLGWPDDGETRLRRSLAEFRGAGRRARLRCWTANRRARSTPDTARRTLRGGAALVRARGAVRRIVRRLSGSRGPGRIPTRWTSPPLLRHLAANSVRLDQDRRQRSRRRRNRTRSPARRAGRIRRECDLALAQRLRRSRLRLSLSRRARPVLAATSSRLTPSASSTSLRPDGGRRRTRQSSVMTVDHAHAGQRQRALGDDLRIAVLGACSISTTTRVTPATRSIAPPMPLTILPGTIQLARSPLLVTSIAPSTETSKDLPPK